MSLELVVTAVGPDRPGIASDFTGHVHAAGANLADTRMVNLRGKFALIALVEGTADVLEAVKQRLNEAAPSIGLRIEFSSPTAKEGTLAQREGVPFRLKTYSMDQPGIVHRITSYLREHGVNVEELVTRLESAPFMGTPVFTMEILMLVPKTVSVKQLRHALEELGDSLNCDVDIDPA
ncbi:MAG TPA: ACT domain-containing protein [Labilithrix sp.]|nr:ACT domain-containing protein [Labilithrix sp.]